MIIFLADKIAPSCVPSHHLSLSSIGESVSKTISITLFDDGIPVTSITYKDDNFSFVDRQADGSFDWNLQDFQCLYNEGTADLLTPVPESVKLRLALARFDSPALHACVAV
ncbi:hypothetical protein BaRGS_00004861 [Batillaria attramentaria]|uniref:Uncharacterized protein n=1 Tax=Batillaria attramentaria TaxID=370345 RepID=A0ABD0LWH1_9CAEN